MRCPRCQNENPSEANFCLHCGAPLKKTPSAILRFFSSTARAVLYFGLFYGMQVLVMYIYLFILSFAEVLPLMMENPYLELTNETMLSILERVTEGLLANTHILMLIAAAATLLVLWTSFYMRRKKALSEMHITRVRPTVLLLSLLFGAVLQVFTSVTVSLIPFPQAWLDALGENNEVILGGSLLLLILNVALVTPIIEEIIFRGLVFTRLRRGMPLGIAVIFSAAIFGFVHGNPIGFIYAGVLGAVLSLLMVRHKDSILPTIACHMAFNGTSLLLSYIPEDAGLVIIALYVASIAGLIGLGYLLFRPNTPVPTSTPERTDNEAV